MLARVALSAAILALSASASILPPTHAHENDLARIDTRAIKIALHAGSTLTLNATSVDDGEYVHVAINNPAFKKSGDWLGLYAADADPTTTAPLKWSYCVPYSGASYATSGVGELTFQVYSIRAPLIFHLFSGGTSKAVLVASSVALPLNDPDAPLHPRVLPGGAPGEFTIAWSTTAAVSNARLAWGTEGGVYPHTVPATLATVPKESLCGAPATTNGWLDLGTIASARFAPSVPAGTRVFYALVDDAHAATVRNFSFVPPPLPGPSYPLRFNAFGDLGRGSWDDGVTWREYGQDSRSTASSLGVDISEGASSFTHHFGDISYAVGFLQTWDEFLYMIQPFAATAPYLIGVGNHEGPLFDAGMLITPPSPQTPPPLSVDYPGTASNPSFGPATDSGGECNVVTSALLPFPAPATANTPYYSFSSGPLTIVVISSEHDFTAGSKQFLWLKATLSAIDRTISPWVLLTSHRPMYVDSNYGGTPTSDLTIMQLLQEHVEPLTAAAKVSLALYGHNHRLERISAAFANRTVLASVPVEGPDGTVHYFSKPKATVHYVAGTAGAAYSQNDCRSEQAQGGVCTIPSWSEEVAFEHGYLRFIIHNSTDMSFEYVVSSNRTILDRVHITQDLQQPWVT